MEYVYTNFNDDFKLKHAEEEGEEEEDSRKGRQKERKKDPTLLACPASVGGVIDRVGWDW